MPTDCGHSLSVLFKVGQAGAVVEEQKVFCSKLENQNTFVAWSKMSARYGVPDWAVERFLMQQMSLACLFEASPSLTVL